MHSRLHCENTLSLNSGDFSRISSIPQDLRDLAHLRKKLKRPRAMRSGRLKHQFPW